MSDPESEEIEALKQKLEKLKLQNEVKAAERELESGTQRLPVKDEIKKSAKRSLIYGVLSLVLLFLFSREPAIGLAVIASGVVGIVFATKSMRQLRSNPNQLEGRSMAITGLVLSVVSLSLMALAMLSTI